MWRVEEAHCAGYHGAPVAALGLLVRVGVRLFFGSGGGENGCGSGMPGGGTVLGVAELLHQLVADFDVLR